MSTLAAYAICERGDIAKLAKLLKASELSKQAKDRLIEVLASTRNVPEIGSRVPKALKSHNRRVFIAAAIDLIVGYRNLDFVHLVDINKGVW